MDGPSHYNEAEKLVQGGSSVLVGPTSTDLTKALIHATLALTAATIGASLDSAWERTAQANSWRDVLR